MGSGFFCALNHTAPSGAFLLGLRPLCAVLPCFVPSAHPELAFCVGSGSMARGSGRFWSVFGIPGRCGFAGMGAPATRHRSGRGPRGRGWVGFFGGWSSRCAFGPFLPRLRRFPALWLGVVARGGGGSGYLWGCGGSPARGHGSACGAAWEWAEPTAGERAGARGRGWVRVLPGNSTLLRLPALPLLYLMAHPCCAFRRLPARRPREGDSGAGQRYVRIGFGSRGVAGLRAGERLRCGRRVGEAHGRGAGYEPRHGMGSGF